MRGKLSKITEAENCAYVFRGPEAEAIQVEGVGGMGGWPFDNTDFGT